jgi:hypothetical protein
MSSTNGASTSAAQVFFFIFFLACTALALLNVYPGDVHRDTSEIYMWGTLGFELIYARHPPLLPWQKVGLLIPHHVRFWHKADIPPAPMNVRYRG